MFPWPSLELTDWERQHVGYYTERVKRADGSYYTKPGVLKRVYPIDLARQDDDSADLEAQLTDELQIARRTRVFGFSFTGDLGSWRLQIRTASGEALTGQERESGDAPVVSAMVPGTFYNEHPNTNIGAQPTADNAQNVHQYGALQIEPNWLLSPNTTMLFEGTIIDEANLTANDQRILTINVHVWEFPGMDAELETGG